jgi:hypothetical protein
MTEDWPAGGLAFLRNPRNPELVVTNKTDGRVIVVPVSVDQLLAMLVDAGPMIQRGWWVRLRALDDTAEAKSE